MVSQHDFMYRKAIIMLYATVFFLYNLLYFGFFDVYGHVYCLQISYTYITQTMYIYTDQYIKLCHVHRCQMNKLLVYIIMCCSILCCSLTCEVLFLAANTLFDVYIFTQTHKQIKHNHIPTLYQYYKCPDGHESKYIPVLYSQLYNFLYISNCLKKMPLLSYILFLLSYDVKPKRYIHSIFK